MTAAYWLNTVYWTFCLFKQGEAFRASYELSIHPRSMSSVLICHHTGLKRRPISPCHPVPNVLSDRDNDLRPLTLVVSAPRSTPVYWTVQAKNPKTNQGSSSGISIALRSLPSSTHTTHSHYTQLSATSGLLQSHVRLLPQFIPASDTHLSDQRKCGGSWSRLLPQSGLRCLILSSCPDSN